MPHCPPTPAHPAFCTAEYASPTWCRLPARATLSSQSPAAPLWPQPIPSRTTALAPAPTPPVPEALNPAAYNLPTYANEADPTGSGPARRPPPCRPIPGQPDSSTAPAPGPPSAPRHPCPPPPTPAICAAPDAADP